MLSYSKKQSYYGNVEVSMPVISIRYSERRNKWNVFVDSAFRFCGDTLIEVVNDLRKAQLISSETYTRIKEDFG